MIMQSGTISDEAKPAVASDMTVVVARSPLPAMAIDREGRIAAANEALARCLACAPEQLAGTELASWSTDPAAVREFLREPPGAPREFGFRAGDGSARWLALSRGMDLADNFQWLSAFDLTERRAAEQALREENERFRSVIGVGGGTLYETNAEVTQIRLWERQVKDGVVTIGQRMARFPDDVIDPRFNPEGLAEAQKCYAAHEPIRNLIYRIPSAEGREIYRLGNSVPFHDKDGAYRGRRGVSIDVTAQIVAERALRESEAQLRRAREHLEHAQRVAATGSSERDLTTGALEWSEEMYRLAGVDRETFVLTDANIFGLVHEEDRERLKTTVLMGRAGTRPPPIEFRMRRVNGQIRMLYCETDVIRDKSGAPSRVLTVFKDVTELRAAEQRQKEMERQLLEVQKLEALSTMAGGVAHELNNTLVPVLALAKMTIARLVEGSREQANLITILQAGEKARDLVQRMVAFSRKDAPTRAEVDLAELTRDALTLLRHSVPETVALVEKIDPVPPLLGDRSQLSQVLINLVMNAVQATPAQTGTVTVEVAAASGERLPQVPDRASGSAIRLSVIDRGCGMDRATLARIFEPFFTTKEVGVGTGLGLAVAHGIVSQHGGRITVESEVGSGSRFDVYFPAASTAVTDEATEPSASLGAAR
jgi:PAS domain S-box-containing protein